MTTLTEIRTVYDEIFYIETDFLTDHPGRLVPLYHADGRPAKTRKHKGSASDWEQTYLHPANICSHDRATWKEYSHLDGSKQPYCAICMKHLEEPDPDANQAARHDHSDEEPTRDYYNIFTNQDGSEVFYLCTMEEHQKYKALYGKMSGKWSYTQPAQAAPLPTTAPALNETPESDPDSLESLFGPVISEYSRAEALEDGMLADLNQWIPIHESGYKFPIACTAAVFAIIEKCAESKTNFCDYKGIIWDVFHMSRSAPVKQWETGRLFKVKIGKKIHTFKM